MKHTMNVIWMYKDYYSRLRIIICYKINKKKDRWLSTYLVVAVKSLFFQLIEIRAIVFAV